MTLLIGNLYNDDSYKQINEKSFEIFIAVMFLVRVFWLVTLCSVVIRYQHFRDP
jgi:hypothetical protein